MIDGSRKLILVRHAAVQMEPAVPSAQWRLSPAGRASCRSLAPLIAPFRPKCFVTSCEPKAIETGQILADLLSLPCRTAENLHEQERKGIPYFESKQEFEAALTRLLTGPDDKQVLGHETAAQARRRFDQAIRKLLANRPLGNMAIVAHGTVITLFLCLYNPALSPVTLWRSLALPDYRVVSLPDFRLQI